jgi:transmembrane protein 216
MLERKPILPAIWLSLIVQVSASWIFWIFWLNILVYIYKGIVLPYAGPYFGLELSYYIAWGLTSVFRHIIGRHGLARCEPTALIYYVIVTVFTIICCNLYFVHFQAYILRMELIFNAFCMAVECVEAVLGIVCAVVYMKQQAM